MIGTQLEPLGRTWTAAELRSLPPEQRNAILVEAAARAEAEYLNNPTLTAFETFGPGDLHGESSDSQPR